jgi:hypothetical protein
MVSHHLHWVLLVEVICNYLAAVLSSLEVYLSHVGSRAQERFLLLMVESVLAMSVPRGTFRDHPAKLSTAHRR